MKKDQLKSLKDLKKLKSNKNKKYNKTKQKSSILNSKILEELHKINDTSNFFEDEEKSDK